jgi:guanosine-diphosphatase
LEVDHPVSNAHRAVHLPFSVPGEMKDYESPPFIPEEDATENAGKEEGVEGQDEESFHILPVSHQNGHHNNAHGGSKTNPSDIATLDEEEMDEPATQGEVQTDGDADVQTDEAAEQEHESQEGLTASEELKPSVGPTSFDDDRDATSTEFCDQPHDETVPIVQYAIVIDAGSTGSRIHVYKFNNCGTTPALEYETFKAIQPGLSSFARDPTAAAASLDPLMQEAVRVVPESLRSCTPVEVKATAGLRLLPGKEGEAILDEVRVRLETDWPFSVAKEDQAIEIMDGKDEGVYAWITANYLLGKIGAGAPEADTMAVMDLGGASTQIVFEPTFPDKETILADGDHKYELSFGGKDYTLYQHSYLGYGLMRARRSVHNLVAFTWSFLQPGGAAGIAWDDMGEEIEVPNPCIGKGMTRRVELDPAGRKSVNVTMSGSSSSFDSCKRVVELVLAKDA